jgi:hypothetical protein
MAGFPKWCIAGLLGGLLGAAVWAGIAYAIHAEIGWIAWGIGFVVGFCVRVSAGENEEGFAPGLTAAVLAILSVLGGKYAAVWMLVASMGIDTIQMQITPDDMIEGFANEIAAERIGKGQKVAFSGGKTLDDASGKADFPPDIWQQATAKWQALPAAEQQKRIAEQQEMMQMLVGAVQGQIRQQGFWESFSLFDALWFLLAAGTAYKLGHGNISSDDDD